MPRKQQEFVIQLNLISDTILIAIVFWLAHSFREHLAYWFPSHFTPVAPFRYYKWLYLIILPLCPFLLDLNRYYTRPHYMRLRHTIWILTKSVALCVLLMIAAVYFLEAPLISRGMIVLFGGFTVVALVAKDLVVRTYLHLRMQWRNNARQVVLVGNEQRNTEFENLILEHPQWNLTVVAKLDPNPESLQKLPSMLHTRPVECVVFNVAQTYFSEVEKAILACEIEGVEAWLVADFVKTSIAQVTVDDFHGKPLLVFRTTPDISWQLACKRLVDIVGATIGLLVLGPLVMLPAGILIRLSSAGSVLFKQKRSGLHSRRFTMYKFRTMTSNAEMLRAELEVFNEVTGPVFKIADDPRVTPVGRLLRRSSIDELPQLWNVLKGEMSLVGPRPPIPSEVQNYDPWHRRRLSMKPGLTCLWQISGRNRIAFDQWMKLDLQYIDNWSLWLDLKILARTVPVVITGMGAN